MPNTDASAEESVGRRLRAAVGKALPCEAATAVRIFLCDRDEDERFVRLAGLDCARAEVSVAYYNGETCPPVLILGLFPPPATDVMANDAATLLRWRGAAFLRYGFTKGELLAAARAVVEGAKAPLPPGVLPKAEDVLRSMAEVRHWLENRLRNAHLARVDFEAALSGTRTLHESHLEPVTAISEAHRDMLARLWMLEGPAARLAPRTGGLTPFKAAVAEFETRWRALEEARAALRASGNEERAHFLPDVRERLVRVSEALSRAITATHDLDSELTAGREV